MTYYRTASGMEIDYVVERRGSLLGIEVKANPEPDHRDALHLGARRAFWVTERVLATPWWTVA